MKTTIELNETDLKAIVAEKFQCSTDAVSVFVRGKIVGYGPGERIEHRCFAEVTVKEEENHHA